MAGAGLIRFDGQGRPAGVNPAARESLGLAGDDEAAGGPAALLDRLLADGRFAIPDGGDAAALAAGEALVLSRRDGVRFTLALAADGDGHLLTIARTAAPPDDGPADPRALPEKHALLETVFDSLSDAVCAFDRDQRLVVWNRPYAEMFAMPDRLLQPGTPCEDLVRHTVTQTDLAPGEDVESVIAGRVAEARRFDWFDYSFRRRDGTIIEARHCPLPGGGYLRRFTDVTSRARAAEAQRAILQAIAFPMVVTRHSDGVLILGNQPAGDFFGVDLTTVTGTIRAADVYADPADRERLLEELRARGGAVDAFETSMIAAGGREARVLLSVRLFRYRGEEAILACISDISARKRAEQDLEAQWSLSRAVLEGLSQGVMAFDREHRLIAWNRRVLDLLEIPPDFPHFRRPLEEITRYVAERGGYGPGPLEEVMARRRALIAAPLPRRNERTRPDGVILETLTRALPDGGFVTTYTDITARKAAERELAASRELFELAIRAAREGISQWNLDTGELWFSPQWWALLGYGEDEAVNTVERWGELILPEDRALSLQVARDFAAGVIDDCQLVQRFRHKLGHTVHLYTRAVKVTDETGRAIRLIGSHTDITERIHAEEAVRAAKEQAERALRELKEAQAHLIQSEKMAALGSLVAGVAHEINTPVGIALTGASLLAERTQAIRRAVDDGRLRRTDLTEYLEVAAEASQLMLLNIDRAAQLIQSFKQMAVDQASEERRVFDLADYIHEVLRSLGVRLRRAAHTVEVDCPADLVMDSYPGALSQVLTNFVMNSITHAYAPGSSGRLRIMVRCPTPDEVELRYSDDGRGIDEALHAKVFEPFFTTSRGTGGSGLGLNIVYNIVTRTLKGRIALDSAPGRGTVFTLRFPRVVSCAEAVA
ncbi:PAS-domain containing protein [Azospirillum halopraeferens]|uniref:PAS-domain containing protein n=1 Tax=Azospirillum halopraeferens TaxID=34010 RepID=UPI0009FE7A7E|nr:PAS-domain containing protein [Azospirillum halopraeferens]